MELKKALELQITYFGKNGIINVDQNGYICLNDLNSYFPHKRLDHWIANEQAKEIIKAVEDDLNTRDSGYLKKAISTKRGRYNGGTYAHELIAMDFASWLSVEFRIHLYSSYINGTQRKQDWNIKRILAANNYKLMCEAVKDAHDPVKHYHFSNEAKMINTIVFGRHEQEIRETATEYQLDAVAWLESSNETLINLDIEYHDRKEKLTALYTQKYLPKHPELEATA